MFLAVYSSLCRRKDKWTALGIPVPVKQQRLSRSKHEQIPTYSEKEESKNHTGRKRESRFFLFIITTDFLRHIDKGKIV